MFLIPTGRRPRPAELTSVSRFDRMMDDVFAGFPAMAAGEGKLFPVTDVSEDDNAVTLILELPGVGSEDVQLSLENTTLLIKAEKKAEKSESSDQVRRVERSFGTFERSFTLSNVIDTDGIEASLADGVLTVVLPKSERAKSRTIEVK